MDMERFARFTVEVGRRGMVRGLLGLVTGVGAAIPFLTDDADAAKKGPKRKKVTAKQKVKQRKAKQRRKAQRRVGAQAETCNPDNPTCEACLNLNGFKVDPPNSGSQVVNLDGCNCTVTYTVTEEDGEPKYLAFTSTCPVQTVFVKGGNGANQYDYPGGSLGASGLHSPINPNNNKPYGISHFNFCGISCPPCICPTGQECDQNGQCQCTDTDKKKCGETCIPKNACCNGECEGDKTCCDGTCRGDQCCGECRDDQICVDGTCECPAGQRECNGACISKDVCCEGQCENGKNCCDGVCQTERCDCPDGYKECGESCIPENECCGGCGDGEQCCNGECKSNDVCCGGCGDDKKCCKGTCIAKDQCCDCGYGEQCCNGECISKDACCEGSCEYGKTCCGGVCQDGPCACPYGEKECNGKCIPEDQCCGGCDDGKKCCNGACKECCNKHDCAYGLICQDGYCIDDGTDSNAPLPDTGQNYTKNCKATCQRKCTRSLKSKQLRGAKLRNTCRSRCAKNCRK